MCDYFDLWMESLNKDIELIQQKENERNYSNMVHDAKRKRHQSIDMHVIIYE